jgi:hypothetical protein
MHNTSECHRFKNDGKKKAEFRSRKKAGKKPSPMKQAFCTVVQENGQAQEGNQERCQENEALLQ